MRNGTIVLTSIAALAAGAHAQVVAIDEFIGEHSEGFENIGPIGPMPTGPAAILGGAGTVTDALANFLMIAISVYSFPTDTNLYAYDGNLFGGSVTGWAVFEFETPVTQFGGFFATPDNASGGSVVFYSDEGDILASQSIALPLGEWTWFGWQSSVGIGRIEFFGNGDPSIALGFDNLQISYVPAPGAAAALAVAGLCARRRRR
mgnify:CR=1 FL=1